MKLLTIISLLALLPFAANAKIELSAVKSYGESTDKDASRLMYVLKAYGAKGHVEYGQFKIKVNGDITQTNGAACDNGHLTYSIQLNELDEKGNQVQTLNVDNSNGCAKPSEAEKFNNLLQQWGGKLLQGDCGLGHCWQKIDSIECTHFDGKTPKETFDSCTVEME